MNTTDSSLELLELSSSYSDSDSENEDDSFLDFLLAFLLTPPDWFWFGFGPDWFWFCKIVSIIVLRVLN